jgi:hypothetical protein
MRIVSTSLKRRECSIFAARCLLCERAGLQAGTFGKADVDVGAPGTAEVQPRGKLGAPGERIFLPGGY